MKEVWLVEVFDTQCWKQHYPLCFANAKKAYEVAERMMRKSGIVTRVICVMLQGTDE